MNKDLLQLIKHYPTKEHSDISASLLGKSKDNLIAMLMDLLTTYYNDLNSSTMRELVVAVLSGYTPNSEKLGYNGFRHNTLTGKVEQCEIKPKNVRSDSTAKNKPKLNGGGNFTDYSWAKFQRHQKENPNMLVAGFVDGQLIHIYEFSFNESDFTARLKDQLEKSFPNGDVTGSYLRSAQFTFNHFKDAPSLKTTCYVSRDILDNLYKQKHVTRSLYNHLRRFT